MAYFDLHFIKFFLLSGANAVTEEQMFAFIIIHLS